MLFASISLLACIVTSVAAQTNSGNNPNPFKVPEGFMITAGQATNVEWTPTTEGPVTLTLRSGANSDLNRGTVIASGIPNSGSYSVNLPADTTRNSDYTLQISSDDDPSEVNFTPQFVVESSNTVASITDASASESMSATDSSVTATDSSMSATASMVSDTVSTTSATSSMMSATSTVSGMSSMTSASARSASSSTIGSSSRSGSSSSGSSSTASSTESSTTAEETPVSAPTSGADGKNVLNVQGGLAVILLGAAVVL